MESMPLMPGGGHRGESAGQGGKPQSRRYVTLDQAVHDW